MSTVEDFYDEDDELELEDQLEPEYEEEYDDGLDELSREFVNTLIDKIMIFIKALVGHDLRTYQKPLARRIIESVVINSQVSPRLLPIP